MKKILMMFTLIIGNIFFLISSVEAAEMVKDLSKFAEVGVKSDIEYWFNYVTYEDSMYVSNNPEIAYIENGQLIPCKLGEVAIDMYYNDGQSFDRCNVTVEITDGTYRLYTYDENNKKKYLETVNTVSDGSLLKLSNIRRAGLERIKQMWRIDCDYDADTIQYHIKPSLDLNTYIRVDGDGHLVFVDSYRNCYVSDAYNNYFYNGVLINTDANGKCTMSFERPEQSEEYLCYYPDDYRIYADVLDEIEPIDWYFEKVTYFQPYMELFDIASDTNEIVEERWIGKNITKTLNDLEIWMGISSSNPTKETVKWYSSDETIVSVDEDTGTVTSHQSGTVIITAVPTNSAIPQRTYTLHVEDFEEGIYYIKNTVLNKYLAAEDTKTGADAVLENSTDGTNTKWRVVVKPNGGYGIQLLNYGRDTLYLSTQDSGEVGISKFNSYSYRDTFIWQLETVGSYGDTYRIVIPYIDVDVEHVNYIYFIPATGEVLFGSSVHSTDAWKFMKIDTVGYSQKIDIAYDKGFMTRYNGIGNLLYENILDTCSTSLCNEFLNEFGLDIMIDSYDLYVSPADNCDKNAGGINKDSINEKCPGHPKSTLQYCSNMKTSVPSYYNLSVFGNHSLNCTSGAVISWEFRPFGNTEPAVLFCGHRLYEDDVTSGNRSYQNPGNRTVMMYSLQNTEEGFADTLIHEMGHMYGAGDHYHFVSQNDEGKWVCGRGAICSVCGFGPYRRDKKCVMNGVYADDYTWCEDCKSEILYGISNLEAAN